MGELLVSGRVVEFLLVNVFSHSGELGGLGPGGLEVQGGSRE